METAKQSEKLGQLYQVRFRDDKGKIQERYTREINTFAVSDIVEMNKVDEDYLIGMKCMFEESIVILKSINDDFLFTHISFDSVKQKEKFEFFLAGVIDKLEKVYGVVQFID